MPDDGRNLICTDVVHVPECSICQSATFAACECENCPGILEYGDRHGMFLGKMM